MGLTKEEFEEARKILTKKDLLKLLKELEGERHVKMFKDMAYKMEKWDDSKINKLTKKQWGEAYYLWQKLHDKMEFLLGY